MNAIHTVNKNHEIWLLQNPIGYFPFRKYYWSYGDTVVKKWGSLKIERDGAITDALSLSLFNTIKL